MQQKGALNAFNIQEGRQLRTQGGIVDDEDLRPEDAADDVDLYDALPLVDDPNHLPMEEELEALHAFLQVTATANADDDEGIVQAPI
jgi:hypothetical protein